MRAEKREAESELEKLPDAPVGEIEEVERNSTGFGNGSDT